MFLDNLSKVHSRLSIIKRIVINDEIFSVLFKHLFKYFFISIVVFSLFEYKLHKYEEISIISSYLKLMFHSKSIPDNDSADFTIFSFSFCEFKSLINEDEDDFLN